MENFKGVLLESRASRETEHGGEAVSEPVAVILVAFLILIFRVVQLELHCRDLHKEIDELNERREKRR